MQVFFTTPATWNKRILLRLSGEPSFTLPIQGYKYGKVGQHSPAAQACRCGFC